MKALRRGECLTTAPFLFQCKRSIVDGDFMIATVDRIIQILDRLAPPRLAESWDTVGLQIGSFAWPVRKIGIALDPLPEVVEEACENDVGLLVTHHPLFFKPLKRILGDTPQGRIIEMALSHKMAIFCAHTNLDSVQGGVNDTLADRLGLQNRRILKSAGDEDLCKLVIFVPLDHMDKMLEIIYSMGVGRIGHYSCCTFRCKGVGTFFPDDAASQAVGEKCTLNEVKENRIEMLVPRESLKPVVNALKKAHPYETMAYDIYPVAVFDSTAGLGRVGELSLISTLEAFGAKVKTGLNLSTVRIVGDSDQSIETVALCSGSGSSLLPEAIASGAQVYVSGDMTYHVARDAQQAGIGLIDIGHFASEYLIVDVLAKKVTDALSDSAFSVSVETVGKESDPFSTL